MPDSSEEEHVGESDQGEHDQPGQRQGGNDQRRHLPVREAALDDLLEPEVVRDVAGAIDQKHREIDPEEDPDSWSEIAERAREEDGGDHEERARHSVVVSWMHGQGRPGVSECGIPLVGVVDGAEEGPPSDQEAEVGSDPRQPDQGEHDDRRDTNSVPAHPSAGPDAFPQQDGEREREGEENSACRDRVRPLHVEVGLVDDARPDDGPALKTRGQAQQRDGAAPCLCGDDRQDRNRRQGQRPVEKDDDSPRSARPAVLAHVVELVDGRSGIGREDLGRDEQEETPEHGDLPKTRLRSMASAGHGR